MKKYILLCLLLASMGVNALGQVRLGLRGGAVTSVYQFEEEMIDGLLVRPVSGSQMGYQLGLVLRLTVPNLIHIQPEINVSSRDYDFTIDGPDGIYPRGRVAVKRLEMPVTAGVNLGPLRLFAGPVFILSQSQETNLKSMYGLDVAFDDSDVALVAGIGLDAKQFFVDIRYTTFRDNPTALYSRYNQTQSVRTTKDFTVQYSVGFFF